MRRTLLLTGLLWGLTLGCITGCTEYSVKDAEYAIIDADYPVDPAHLSQDALAEVPDHQVCRAYAKKRSPRLKAELERRGTFTESEWQAILEHQVVLGMGEMSLMTALPGIARTRTLRSSGVVTKEWYCAKLSDQFVKVRTENGKVVWFSDSEAP
jgi:hypothetical protein